MAKKLTHAEYENRLFDIESDLYPEEEYRGMTTKLIHNCIKGHKTLVAPNSVLAGSRCTICSGYKKKDTTSYSKELTDKKLNLYPIEEYKGSKEYIKHKCSNCGYEVNRKPFDLLAGNDCRCTKIKLSPMDPAILYVVSIKGGYYKLGLTQTTVKERFKKEKLVEDCIVFKSFPTKLDAWAEEQKILLEYKEFFNISDKVLKYGNTELFTSKDILQKIKARLS